MDFVLPHMIIGRQHRTDSKTPAEWNLAYEDVTIIASDSIQLEGFYIPSQLDTVYGTFLVLHGIGACKEYMIDLGYTLSSQGINVFVYDSRGHGKSTGDYLTYGYKERNDVVDIINYLDKHYNTPRYGIWGASYGGAVALNAMSIDKRIELGVIESTFASVREVVFDYKKRLSGIGWHWLSDRVLDRAAAIAEFDPDAANPEDACRKITQPIIMAHGDSDRNISVEYGKRNFAALASADKEFYIVKGGDHNDMWAVGGEEYGQKLLGFIAERWME